MAIAMLPGVSRLNKNLHNIIYVVIYKQMEMLACFYRTISFII